MRYLLLYQSRLQLPNFHWDVKSLCDHIHCPPSVAGNETRVHFVSHIGLHHISWQPQMCGSKPIHRFQPRRVISMTSAACSVVKLRLYSAGLPIPLSANRPHGSVQIGQGRSEREMPCPDSESQGAPDLSGCGLPHVKLFSGHLRLGPSGRLRSTTPGCVSPQSVVRSVVRLDSIPYYHSLAVPPGAYPTFAVPRHLPP